MIDSELQKYSEQQPAALSDLRISRLSLVREFLKTYGFPCSRRERFELALHPFYFQEANYDDLDPYSLNGNLGHLKNIYEIDLAVQSGGFTRESISKKLFTEYRNRLSAVVAWRQGRPRLQEKLLFVFSKMRSLP